MFTAAVMQTEVEILNGETFYVRFGDWFAWGMTITSLAIILLGWKRSFRGTG
jgi:apolipoprotein N-acyltransferase